MHIPTSPPPNIEKKYVESDQNVTGKISADSNEHNNPNNVKNTIITP